MRNVIVTTAYVIAISIAVLLTVNTANAATVAEFQIPFHFFVGEKALPAGVYTVSLDNATNRFDMVSPEAVARVFLTGSTPRRNVVTDTGTLVFYRYGKTHVLRSFWTPGSSSGQNLPGSAILREMTNVAALPEIVSIGATSK
jgi:hypothetical protein